MNNISFYFIYKLVLSSWFCHEFGRKTMMSRIEMICSLYVKENKNRNLIGINYLILNLDRATYAVLNKSVFVLNKLYGHFVKML